uniref:Potassium/proton antiporter CemA n=1 Tax=Borodinellopsis insignis TaxID=3229915 RepID=A0AB39A676_9CHLO
MYNNKKNQWSANFLESNLKQDVVSITYEEIGLFPRSFSRVLDRFLKQVFSDVENLVIQEYRFYRYLFLTTLKCVLILFIVPFFVNFLAKNYLVRPLTEYFWNTKQTEIFLNSYQQKRAFAELKDFEEKLYFESLILPKTLGNISTSLINNYENTDHHGNSIQYNKFYNQFNKTWKQLEANQQRLQEKTIELAVRYNNQSIEAITNFFADLISFFTLFYLLFVLEIQINITKSFLLEVFFGLDDSKKSLLILLVTDLLVGYHSSNIWELFFEFLLNHYGLPESQTGIFLLVATLPVLLDVLFKYLIFRHLNRSSPATVATYHAMIE